ncbi:PP2C family serine/threonine-protein phosphatase [uncultured Methanoregula sp.]|uniref:PP2C family serine/threonine-protein phosphatase n=1 Tax=uncultured Methanoregula sp. TaxID=1005933 RepID=UPI002AAA8EC5|nr:PP2C family serine/threonine-protein phosphatase [uncultured Methanoregula sp.]
MTWMHIAASVTGISHKNRHETGQDYCRATVVQFGDREYFIGLAADGAGSTTEGGVGAQIACDTILSCITDSIRGSGGDLAQVLATEAEGWVAASRDAIAEQARVTGKNLREYACTLVGCVIADNHAWYFQVGDGGIVIHEEPGYSAVFWPDQGEYANTTYFITDDAFLSHLCQLRSDTPPDEIALFTDGLQNLVLSFSKRTPHAGFFRPLFETLRKSPGGENGVLTEQLRTFLLGREINERSDDDKTLILAVR